MKEMKKPVKIHNNVPKQTKATELLYKNIIKQTNPNPIDK
jgi:hypothetical protein